LLSGGNVMAEIKTFRAIRYSKEIITNYICPPYEVIDSGEKARLQRLSPFNIVNIELPDSRWGKNKYRYAANLLRLWQNDKIHNRDKKSSFYFYEQVFDDHGIKMTRRGFFADLKLENPYSEKSSIKLHEEVLPKLKADRLSLLRATKANISPIFALFNDENHTVIDICRKIIKRYPSATAKDKDGTFHRLWVVSEEAIIKVLEKYLSTKKIFIADGHHGYEAAWNYSQERKEKDKNYSPYKEYNYTLVYLCPLEDLGISIWPIHRVLAEPKDLEENIEKYFDLHPLKDFQKLSKREIQPMMIFKCNKYRVLTIKKETFLKKLMPDKERVYRNLAVSALHYVLMPKVDDSEFIYVKDSKEAVLLARKTGSIAIIVPSISVESLKNISLKNEIMPQKSTYFYPKLASGLVINSLK
jgi:uncharacterized protein (DUF1015 family)